MTLAKRILTLQEFYLSSLKELEGNGNPNPKGLILVKDRHIEAIRSVAERQCLEEGESPWYDLGRLMPYRDLLLAMGFVLILMGVGLIYYPAVPITAGIGLIRISWLMGKGK